MFMVTHEHSRRTLTLIYRREPMALQSLGATSAHFRRIAALPLSTRGSAFGDRAAPRWIRSVACFQHRVGSNAYRYRTSVRLYGSFVQRSRGAIDNPFVRLLPVSAFVIMCIGAFICYEAISSEIQSLRCRCLEHHLDFSMPMISVSWVTFNNTLLYENTLL